MWYKFIIIFINLNFLIISFFIIENNPGKENNSINSLNKKSKNNINEKSKPVNATSSSLDKFI